MPPTPAPTRPRTEPAWLTVTEAASRLSVSKTTIRRWIDAGTLRADHVGPRLVRIPTTELARLSGCATSATLAEQIKRIVDAAPPLTPEQVERIRTLLQAEASVV